MFNYPPKVLHLESTTICNAECPQCPREDNTLFNKQEVNTLTLLKCKELFSPEFINGLDKMFMCGNFGDPTASNHTLDIFKYFKQCNSTITIGLNTNGSIQNTKWWTDLASIMSNNTDYVVFSIDGLHNTNHIYRKNVSWNKLINNATAFINAGGNAHWDMLIFEHNEHQVNEAEQLALDMGFAWFRTKVSKRFAYKQINDINPPLRLNLPNAQNTSCIKCHAYNEKSIYVSASGKTSPCCWLGVYEFTEDALLDDLLNSPNWSKLRNSWNKTPHIACSRNCGSNNNHNKSSFEAQWNKEIQLK